MSGIECVGYTPTSVGSRVTPIPTPRWWMPPSSTLRTTYTLDLGLAMPKETDQSATLSNQVVSALTDTRFDWRTPVTIGNELELPVEAVRTVLDSLVTAGVARHPYGDRMNEREMYRLVDRGHTTGERFRAFRELLTRG